MNEAEVWQGVKDMLGNESMELGYHWSYNLREDPKRLGFVLSRYKFAAKMIGSRENVLELGCSEGIGAPILSENAKYYQGIDMDSRAIQDAHQMWDNPAWAFKNDDFMGKTYGVFDAIVSMDVVEHIYPAFEKTYWQTVFNNLSSEGVVVIGTPNITSAPYASEASQIGHVNLFNAERLKHSVERLCHNVFLFGMNDEMVHTGYHPMCHFLVAVGCYKREVMLHEEADS